MPCPSLFYLSPRGEGHGDHSFPGINPLEGSIKLFFFFLRVIVFSVVPRL